MNDLTFRRLNTGWNAEPNAPELTVSVNGATVALSFYLNPYAYDAEEDEIAQVIFTECSRWRWDATNDEGWFRGKGRFALVAPKWGEFYEIVGVDPTIDDQDWDVISSDRDDGRHFLFYFRDEAIECVAADWRLVRK